MQFSNPNIFQASAIAAAAGTVLVYKHVGDRPVSIKGYQWSYLTAEANTDNTLDFAIEYSTDGSAWTAIKVNGNPNGLLDTGVPLDVFDKRADAASGGAAALASAAFTPVRVPANAIIRFTIVRAGTGTIPAIELSAYGQSR